MQVGAGQAGGHHSLGTVGLVMFHVEHQADLLGPFGCPGNKKKDLTPKSRSVGLKRVIFRKSDLVGLIYAHYFPLIGADRQQFGPSCVLLKRSACHKAERGVGV
jgi:hypothetical protein